MGNIPDGVFGIFKLLHKNGHLENDPKWETCIKKKDKRILTKLPHKVDRRIIKYLTSNKDQFVTMKNDDE